MNRDILTSIVIANWSSLCSLKAYLSICLSFAAAFATFLVKNCHTSGLFKGRLQNAWHLRPLDAIFKFHLVSSFQLIASYPPLPHSFHLPSYFRVPRAGSRRPAQMPGGRPPRLGPRWVPEAATPEAGPGSPAPRPARPTTQCATQWTRDAGVTGMPEGVGGDRVGRARGGPGEEEVWRRWGILKVYPWWSSM